MLPIILKEAAAKAGLAGEGEGLRRRQMLLSEAGVSALPIARDAPADDLADLKILFIAGLDREVSAGLAMRARACGVLVNVEDVPELCDFHVPAAIRRGDLVVTVSTGGKAPGLSRVIREWLERRLGSEWAGRLQDIATRRATWRAEGHPPQEVSRRMRAHAQDWLP